MKTEVIGGPAFARIDVELEPGESVTAESDAMASMDADLDLDTRLNGGCVGGILRKFLGGESLMINDFINNQRETRKISLVQATPGSIQEIELTGNEYFLQPGAYIASTKGVDLGLSYAGFASWFGGEGLFRLRLSGRGKAWFGAYGQLIEKEVDGEYIVDTSHLVGYDPQLKLNVQLSGGLFSSMFSGEGFVTRIEGRGKIIIQTRSMDGLASWVNQRLW